MKSIHAAATRAWRPSWPHRIFFFQAPKKGVRFDDACFTSIEVVLPAFDAHALLGAIFLREEIPAVATDETRYRRTRIVLSYPQDVGAGLLNGNVQVWKLHCHQGLERVGESRGHRRRRAVDRRRRRSTCIKFQIDLALVLR